MNPKKIILLILAALSIFLFFYLGLDRYLTLESLKKNKEILASFYATHKILMVTGFMAIYITQTALSLPGATILSLSAGAIFGAAMGTVYTNISATIGATLAFLAVRYLFYDSIQKKFGARLEPLNRELMDKGLNYLLFLRLVPVFPFFLINIGAGLTKLPLRTFIIGTMVGIIPGGFVYCNAGASLATLNSLHEISSPRVLISFGLLGIFALIPALYNKLVKQKKQRRNA